MLNGLDPFIAGRVVLLDNPRRVAHSHRVGRDIFSDNGPGGNYAMFSYPYPGRDNGVGANPAIVFNHNWGYANALLMNRLSDIGVVVVQSAGDDVLREDHIVPNRNRADDHITQPNQRVIADPNFSHHY